jgi:hypothetical protein
MTHGQEEGGQEAGEEVGEEVEEEQEEVAFVPRADREGPPDRVALRAWGQFTVGSGPIRALPERGETGSFPFLPLEIVGE